jgi:hypothetical protein
MLHDPDAVHAEEASNPYFAYHHHQSLEALQSSAKACELCALLLQEVITARSAFERVKDDPWLSFRPPTYSLRLTKRMDKGQGFIAWSLSSDPDSSSLYLMAAIGLGVDEGL